MYRTVWPEDFQTVQYRINLCECYLWRYQDAEIVVLLAAGGAHAPEMGPATATVAEAVMEPSAGGAPEMDPATATVAEVVVEPSAGGAPEMVEAGVVVEDGEPAVAQGGGAAAAGRALLIM